MTTLELKEKLYEFICPKYPNIQIDIKDAENNKRELYFIEEKFTSLYPKQRYHYLAHCIPEVFFLENLQDTIWFELAPDENPEDLEYHDEEIIKDIKEPILFILKDKVSFVSMLDKAFCFENAKCSGDFIHSKKILTDLGFSQEDQFDIFHVLIDEGGYCDCEILYNVFRESEYAKNYWRNRKG